MTENKKELVGKLPLYFCNDSDWCIYSEKLAVYFKLNNLTAKEQLAVLTGSVCPEIYQTIHIICYPKTINVTTFDDIFLLLNGQYISRKDCDNQTICWWRRQFYRAKQQPNESVIDWLERLKHLTIGCAFRDNFQSIITDQFIAGLKAGIGNHIAEQFSELKFDQIVKLALEFENCGNN